MCIKVQEFLDCSDPADGTGNCARLERRSMVCLDRTQEFNALRRQFDGANKPPEPPRVQQQSSPQGRPNRRKGLRAEGISRLRLSVLLHHSRIVLISM